MGSIIYDFLNESFLFDKTLEEEDFASISEAQLKQELDKYRQHALSNINELGAEICQNNSQLKVFGDNNESVPRHAEERRH